MYRRSLRIASVFTLALAWAACSDSPVQPTLDESDLVSAESQKHGSVASDASSLQKALDAAAEGGGQVRVRGTIVLEEPLTYQSDKPLVLQGSHSARIVGPAVQIDAPSNSGSRVGEETAGDGLQILGAPNLTVRNLTFEGQSGHGIYFELTDDASGTVRVGMTHTRFVGQGLSGMWIEDQTGGSESAPEIIESSASIFLNLRNVSVSGTGFAEDDARSCRSLAEGLGCSFADFDGFRINEGGDGNITFAFQNVDFTENAGDGIEFDETGSGGVRGVVRGSDFSRNGEQPQFPEDLEDGFDIDEAGPGGIHVAMLNTRVNDNIDEGIDLDESDLDEAGQDVTVGAGDVFFSARRVVATGNADENIKISDFVEVVTFDANGEEVDAEVLGGAGDIILAMAHVTADGSAEGRGARFEEFGQGDVRGYIRNSSFSGNSEDDGLRVDEEDDGSIDLKLWRIDASRNDGQGLQMTENGAGDILAYLFRSTFTDNDNTAVEMEEEDAGGHTVVIRGSTLVGSDGEESLDVIETDDGSSHVVIRGGTIDPAPVSEGDVTFEIQP